MRCNFTAATMKEVKDVTTAMNSPARSPSEIDPPVRRFTRMQPTKERANKIEK